MTNEVGKDINDIRHSSISDIIGQRSVVDQVKVAISAAQRDGRKFDHALLVGPPGLGKTATSQVIAAEMETEFIEVLGQSISRTADLNAVLMTVTDKSIVFIDEAHELPNGVQTALYLALDQQRVSVRLGRKGSPVNVRIADFSLLLASTDEYRLLQPLRDRMRLHLRFEFYCAKELTRILRYRSKALAWAVENGLLPQIARRSRGIPRQALRLLQAAHRVCRSEDGNIITRSQMERACQLDQIDELGLGLTEQQYLQILLEGPTRLNVLASRFGLPMRTISHVIEPFLVRVGLIAKDDQGRRVLTSSGREHLRTYRQLRV